jgi:hypothetical protein
VEWRFVEEGDLEWVLKGTKEMFDESEWGDREYDEESVKKFFHQIIDNPSFMFGIIALRGEKKIGFMSGHIIQFTFMKDYFAKETELYVIPSERGKMGGLFMMRKFIEWAKSKKVRQINFEPSANKGDIKKFDVFAKRLGMTKEPNYRIKL